METLLSFAGCLHRKGKQKQSVHVHTVLRALKELKEDHTESCSRSQKYFVLFFLDLNLCVLTGYQMQCSYSPLGHTTVRLSTVSRK